MQILNSKGISKLVFGLLILIFSIAAHHHFSLLILKDKESVFIEKVEVVLGPAVDIKVLNQ